MDTEPHLSGESLRLMVWKDNSLNAVRIISELIYGGMKVRVFESQAMINIIVQNP